VSAVAIRANAVLLRFAFSVWAQPGCHHGVAAATLARDENAMQHRLQKVISSYSFSSATLNQLGEDQFNDNPWQEQDEEELQQEQQLQLQPNGSSPGNNSTLAPPQQQGVKRRQS
jgi:hypothetical protein